MYFHRFRVEKRDLTTLIYQHLQEMYCKEVKTVHLYDVVDRMLIAFYRDTTRHVHLRATRYGL